MNSLQPPDSHHLSSAIGWLELGCPEESRLDLEKLAPQFRNHPDVLEVFYGIEAEQKNWQAAELYARQLTEIAPKRSFGWTHLAYALHELKQTEAARTVIRSIMGKFRSNWLMRYNLACYECQLGNETEALDLLKEACKLGKADRIKEMALGDPDLKPIWGKI